MRLHRSFVVSFVAGVLVIAAAFTAKTQTAGVDKVAALAWMSGKWALERNGSRQEEIWTSPGGGSMIGMMRVIRDGKTTQREFNLIEETSNGVELILGHVGPDMKLLEGWPVTMKLIRCSDWEAWFEAVKPGRLKSIFYHKTGADDLLAGIQVDRNGTVNKIEFPMKREKL